MDNPTRTCTDCGIGISDRHGNTKRCVACVEARHPASVRKVKNPTPAWTASCSVCEQEFQTRSHKKATCSLACRNWARRHPGQGRPKDPRCSFCDEPISKRARTVYCSQRCRTAAGKRRRGTTTADFLVYDECQHCGASLVGQRAGKKYCSVGCEIREYNHPGSYVRRAGRRCEYCGDPLDPRERINRRHCSDACTVKANQVVRRARRKRLPAERFARYEIFERDGWICHLCDQPIDPALRDKHPQSASIDHLIPFADANSPGHVRANVALAHLRCNISKNGRVRPEDWALHRILLEKYEEDEAWRPRRRPPPQPLQLSAF